MKFRSLEGSIMARRSPAPVADLEARVVQAALSLGDSLDGVSMPQLAKTAQLAVGTLYRVAPSKAQLAELVETRVLAWFEGALFAPFPARLTHRERLDLMLDRIAAFQAERPDAGRYLAARGLRPGDGFVRAASGFARDGSAAGVLKSLEGPVLAALIFGPVSALIRLQGHVPDGTALASLKQALWDAVAAASAA
jgi:AcrR family transcriptional regulator